MSVIDVSGVRVLDLPLEGPPLGTEQDALDVIGGTFGQEIDVVAIPAGRLHPDFLLLRTGMAGAFLQKMQNYRYRTAIVGDIAAAIAASDALRDFVRESNRVGQVLFVRDAAELALRLG